MSASASSPLAAAAAIAVSPLLAAWTANLVGDQRRRRWQPRRVRVTRWLVVAITAAVFAAVGARGAPALAWWLLAVTGAVLAIVDGETHRLPARLLGPLAAAETTVLITAALVLGEPDRLGRVLLAAAVVAAAYFLIAFAAPSAIGLGDVYVVGITSGLLGWSGWNHVLTGQLLIWLLSPVLAVAVALGRPQHRGWRMQVPMGPVFIAGSLIACWL